MSTARRRSTRRTRSASAPTAIEPDDTPEGRHIRRRTRVQPVQASPPKRRSIRGSRKSTTPTPAKENVDVTPTEQVEEPKVVNDACLMDVGDDSLQLANEDFTTPKKTRVLVAKDVQLPHGKRLKRTVRTEHRKIAVPADVMRKYELDVSRWECRQMYKSIDSSLAITEQLDELVSRIMLSDYYREGLTNVDEAAMNAADYLAKAESEPKPRVNPDNTALQRRIVELKKTIKTRDAELAGWKRAEAAVVEMELNSKVLPLGKAEPMRISGAEEAKKAFKNVLLQCSDADQRLHKVEMQTAATQEQLKNLVTRFNVAVRTGVKHAKTPRRPAVFPGGAAVAAITPRAV